MTRSYYSNTISDFLNDDNDKILGQLIRNHDFAAENLQRNAWIKQIEILKSQLSGFKHGQFILNSLSREWENELTMF